MSAIKKYVAPEERLERLEQAVKTLVWWLVQAQTGFAAQDARGIEDILAGTREKP